MLNNLIDFSSIIVELAITLAKDILFYIITWSFSISGIFIIHIKNLKDSMIEATLAPLKYLPFRKLGFNSCVSSLIFSEQVTLQMLQREGK